MEIKLIFNSPCASSLTLLQYNSVSVFGKLLYSANWLYSQYNFFNPLIYYFNLSSPGLYVCVRHAAEENMKRMLTQLSETYVTECSFFLNFISFYFVLFVFLLVININHTMIIIQMFYCLLFLLTTYFNFSRSSTSVSQLLPISY